MPKAALPRHGSPRRVPAPTPASRLAATRSATDRLLATAPAPSNRPDVALLHVGLCAVVEQLQALDAGLAALRDDLADQGARAQDWHAEIVGLLAELRDALAVLAD